ncbi:MAG: hypothetical protein WC423_01100, partial [Vulcanimicrobiota bacterium]
TPLRFSNPSDWSSKDDFPKRCFLAAFLTANIDGSPQPSFLLWTYHGVVIKREALPPLGCVGITILLCGDELSVDLSGLQLIEGQFFEIQRRNALVLAKQALIDLAGPFGDLSIKEDEDSLLEKVLGLVGLGEDAFPKLGSVELDLLKRHLGHLGAKYWSP